MNRWIEISIIFIKGLSHNWLSLLGAAIATISFPFLLGCMLYDNIVHIENPYFGGFVYMILGPAFLSGLILIFIGLIFGRDKDGRRLCSVSSLHTRLDDRAEHKRIRTLFLVGLILTCINLAVVSALAYNGYHYMESNAFCGEVCHVPMTAEYSAHQNSSHSRVACVECHIGSGASWFAKSKISGAQQLLAVAADTYSRPIETPIHGLRPARDTCEQCHRPEKFLGDKLVVKNSFLEDENNTQVKTVLLLKIGSAGDLAAGSHGIHWHVAPENRITYKAVDRQRNRIPEVSLKSSDGDQIVFRSAEAEEQLAEAEQIEERTMDCIDCHNRPSHVYLPADKAIDNKILTQQIPVELPYIKQQALKVVSQEYTTREEARTAISDGLRAYYQAAYSNLYKSKRDLIEQAITGVQAAYLENVYPEMGIEWNTYRSNIGHSDELGCFRCHNEEHESEGGAVISMDCDSCHTILAEEEEDPEILNTLRGE